MIYEQLTLDSYAITNSSKRVESKVSIRKYGVALVKEDTIECNSTLGSKVHDSITAFEIAKSMEFADKSEEEFWIACLDAKNIIIGLHMVSRGSLSSSIVHPREVFKRAILNNASGIICMHNHPSGNPAPSQADSDVTRRLVEAGELIGIRVIDHIIVGDETYVSLKEKMLF